MPPSQDHACACPPDRGTDKAASSVIDYAVHLVVLAAFHIWRVSVIGGYNESAPMQERLRFVKSELGIEPNDSLACMIDVECKGTAQS